MSFYPFLRSIQRQRRYISQPQARKRMTCTHAYAQDRLKYEPDCHGHNTMVGPSFHILETHIDQALGKRVFQ